MVKNSSCCCCDKCNNSCSSPLYELGFKLRYYTRPDCNRIAYFVKNNGLPAIALLHPLPADSSIWYCFVQRLLKTCPNNKIILIDILGLGCSDKPNDPEPYALELLTNDLYQILRKENAITNIRGLKPIIGGWSIGGLIALNYAATRPKELSKLFLVGAAPKLTISADWPFGFLPPEIVAQIAQALRAGSTDPFFTFFDLVFAAEIGCDPQALQTVKTNLLNRSLNAAGCFPTTNPACNPTSVANLLDLGIVSDIRNLMPNIRVPVLFIQGSTDPVVKFGAAQATADLMTCAPIKIVRIYPGRSHFTLVTDVNISNEIIQFIKKTKVKPQLTSCNLCRRFLEPII